MNKNKANNVFQTSIFDNEPGQRPASVKNTPVEKAGKRKDAVKEPATTLMKTVAEKAFVESKARKVFSQEEIDEILDKKTFGEDLTKQDRAVLRMQYKKMKSWVKEKEAGNQSQVIAIPSLTDGTDEFYKVFDFSALYYVYRLADRMGRNATLRIDKDERPKMLYQASIKDIEKFTEQFQELENPTVEKTLEGVVDMGNVAIIMVLMDGALIMMNLTRRILMGLGNQILILFRMICRCGNSLLIDLALS